MFGFPDIFLRAFANACGCWVISAAAASAKYSRLREIAKRMSIVKKYPIVATINAMTTTTIVPLPSLFRLLPGE